MDELRQAWERDGYVVLREAAPRAALAAYAEDRERLGDGVLVRAPGDERVSLPSQVSDAAGAVDPYAVSEAARELLLAPAVTDLLTGALYDGTPPLLFDAAETAAGAPDEGPYRDATFTALASAPERLATIAVATGDAALVVFPGSHRIATAPFSGRYRHFNPERDGEAALRRHRDELTAALGQDAATDTITLSAGDVVVWAADLFHRPVSGAALVGHLAPCDVQPGWFAYRQERARQAPYRDGAAFIASQHYDLVDAITPEQPPAGEDPEEIERVEEALREHDQELAVEPPPNPATPSEPAPDAPASGRRGGFLGSVRGIMGRRGRGGGG
jgi:Phytanoyl-CoA dioxygenase (PhyH)